MISKLERRSPEALEAPYNELAAAVHTAEVIGADETGWREDRHKAWLWVAVTALFTVFTIARNRSARMARSVLGTQDGSNRGDRPRRRRRTDREEAVVIVGSAVPMVASARGRDSGSGRIPHGDGPIEARGQDGVGERGALRVRADPGDLHRDPAGRGEPVDLRAGGGCAADQQRRGARRAARGDLAPDQRGYGNDSRQNGPLPSQFLHKNSLL